MDLDILVKHFSNFAANGILSIGIPYNPQG